MAEAIDRSTDTVCNIERGFGSTRIETIFRIANVLGVSVSEVFEIDLPLPTDRDRSKLIDQLVELVSAEDGNTIEAIIAQAEISLRIKAQAAKPLRHILAQR